MRPAHPTWPSPRPWGVTFQTVGKWRRRFLAARLDGLLDAPRPRAPRSITDGDVERVVRKTLEERPDPADATHWSTRTMARAAGVTQTAVVRIWHAYGLQPHREETFKLSTDPLFIDKVRDVVGLYLAPPERALVLCVDEKTQVQALDHTAPLLQLRPGQPQRRTHDDARHGTTSLFAALDVASGKVIARCHQRHRAREFRQFLTTIDQEVPANRASLCSRRRACDGGALSLKDSRGRSRLGGWCVRLNVPPSVAPSG